MKTLFVSNGATTPCGSPPRWPGEEVRIVLLGDAARCAKAGQSVPKGYYNLERMIRAAVLKNTSGGVCGTCMDARGLEEEELVEGAARSTLEELADWTQWSERVLAF